MFEYNIYTEPDEGIFKKQCIALERNIPNLCRDNLLTDIDGSKTTNYWIKGKKITVHNSYYIGAVFIESEIDLEPFLPNLLTVRIKTMFDIDTKVRVKKHNIMGTIIDIIETSPKVYIVESDNEGFLDIGYGGRYPLFNCTSDEIELCSYDMQ